MNITIEITVRDLVLRSSNVATVLDSLKKLDVKEDSILEVGAVITSFVLSASDMQSKSICGMYTRITKDVQ